MNSLKIKFEISDEKLYDLDLVSKIERSRQDFNDGKGIVVKLEVLNDFWK